MAATARVLLVLLVLTISFFSLLVYHPGQVLYSDHSDLLAEHIPAKRFLVRSFHETGELPLWCPYHFAGSPFVHDIQVAMFYPPHLVLLLFPEEQVGRAVSWLVVLHVLLTGWLMFAYTRHRGLSPLAGAVASIGYMFAGRWMMHLLGGGHYITIGLAWLPLVLLCLERAIRLGSVAWAVGAGAAFALLTLGTQPQWTFYAGLFIAAWTLGTTLEGAGYLGGTGAPSRDRTMQALRRWLSCGLLSVGLALALAAVQLLPTLEAAGQSSRAGGVGTEAVLDGGVRVVLFLVGPALTVEPANLMWEDRGGLALLWLCAAVLAPVLRGGQVRYQAAVGVGLFLFAAGGAVLFQPLPGFNLFRQPARMMVIASFPVAWLAGVSADALFPPGGLSAEQRRRCRRWMLRVGAAILVLCGGFALRQLLQGAPLRFDLYWLAAPLAFTLAFYLLGRGNRPFLRYSPAGIWMLLLFLDLLALNISLIGVWPEAELYDAPECVRFVAGKRNDRGRVLDVDNYEKREGQPKRPAGSPLWTGAPLALLEQVDAVRGYSPLDVLRYREFLQFIADADDPLGALASNFTHPVINNFDLENRSLLNLLGVRYLLLPLGVDPPGDRWKEVSRQEDVTVYDFILGGWWQLHTYVVYQNENVLPRAFVVPRAEPLPERSAVLQTLKATDFRNTVLLEDYDPPARREAHPGAGHTVRIHRYEPNRVELDVSGAADGYLVLTDVWYPGWECTVDGAPVRVYRANYAFRAVEVPAGKHEVVFRFEPASYRRGRLVSLGALAAVLLFAMGLLVRRVWQAEPAA